MAEEIAGEIILVDLSAIKLNPDNPNYHTADQVQLLARNIKRYGLRNAIELKKVALDDGHQYEILTGEGRYLAHCHLQDTEATDEWTRIPAVIRDDGADVQTECGRRLSENAVRSFNWVAECIEMATLKESGETTKSLMESFGYKKSTIANVVAAGECLKRANLGKEEVFQLTGTLTRQEFINHIVPLRFPRENPQTKKGQRGFGTADPEAYDYAPVSSCIRSILSTELKKEDIPKYSQEHRPSEKIRAVKKNTEEQAANATKVAEITPIIQNATEKTADAQQGTGEPQESPDPVEWIISAVSEADLSDVTWVILGKGTPPAPEWVEMNGGKQVIVRPDIPERQPAQIKLSGNRRELSQKAVKPEKKPLDGDEFKECFGEHPAGIQPECLLCTDEADCEIASKYAVRCFGKHPEHSDTRLKPSYNCQECQYLTDCIRETTAVVDNGKVDFSDVYGDLKGSGKFSELYYVPTNSDTPILADKKFLEKRMLLTSRRWATAIRPFAKDDRVREIFQKDHLGNVITRTTKNPTRTMWYLT
ncbi:MAG: ParB/RepB/Spo0J family partition protein [Desulfomonilaceae bacterium]